VKMSSVIHADFEDLCDLIRNFPANEDVYDRLKYLVRELAHEQEHFLVLGDAGKIIAAGSVQENPYDERELWVCHVSTDPDHQNQGHAKNILRAIADYALEKDYTLATGAFEQDGLKYLAPILPQGHQQEYPGLKVRFDTEARQTVTGEKAYTLEQECAGDTTIVRIDGEETAAKPSPSRWARFRALPGIRSLF
jgi:GNAT superfamily N-acetyltransferase